MSNKSALGAFSPYNPNYGRNAALVAFGATMLQNAGRQPFGRGAPMTTAQGVGSAALAGLGAYGQAEQQQYARTKPNYQVINDKLVSITPPSERGGTPTVEEVADYGTPATPVTMKGKDGYNYTLNKTTMQWERSMPDIDVPDRRVIGDTVVDITEGGEVKELWSKQSEYEKAKQRVQNLEQSLKRANLKPEEKARLERELEIDKGRLNTYIKQNEKWSTPSIDTYGNQVQISDLTGEVKIIQQGRDHHTQFFDDKGDFYQRNTETNKVEKISDAGETWDAPFIDDDGRLVQKSTTGKLNILDQAKDKWSLPYLDESINGYVQRNTVTNEIKILPTNKKYKEEVDEAGNLWQIEIGTDKKNILINANDSDGRFKYNNSIEAARKKLEANGIYPKKGSYVITTVQSLADTGLGKDALTASKKLLGKKDQYYEKHFGAVAKKHSESMGKKPDDKTDEQEVMPWEENYEKQPDLERPPVDFENLPLNPNASLTDPTTVNAKKSNISMAKKTEIENAIQKLLQLRNMPNADIEALDFNINLLQQELIKRSK
jgi:hypothetical protein